VTFIDVFKKSYSDKVCIRISQAMWVVDQKIKCFSVSKAGKSVRVFLIVFLLFLMMSDLKAETVEGKALLCKWEPVVALPERMTVFGLFFDKGKIEMLGINEDGGVNSSGLGLYTENLTHLFWEGAPLFGRNTLNRQTLKSPDANVQCELSQSPTFLKSQLEILGQDL